MATGRFIFAGGGTGGHLFPAIAIAQELKKMLPDAEIMFVGTRDKIEARVVPQSGFVFAPITVAGFHRRKIVANLLFPAKVALGMMQALSVVRNFRPDVVIGTGGYVSGPVVYAATLLGIPTVIQDQNGAPGVTTKLLSRSATEVHLTFESSRRFLKRQDNIFISGNPTRDALDHVDAKAANEYFGFDPADPRKTLLVFGGSLGARSINSAMLDSIGPLLTGDVRMIWQTGQNDYHRIAAATAPFSSATVCVRPFIDRMEYAYSISTLVVCRAGATTIAELTRTGKPAILVPYPHAAANHQVENARSVADAGGAVMIADDALGRELQPRLTALLRDETALRTMSEKSRQLAKPNAGRDIAGHIAALAAKGR